MLKIFNRIRRKYYRIREYIWFKAPRWLHVIDYWLTGLRFRHNIYFPWIKSRGLRYYEKKLEWIDPDMIKYYDSERLFSAIYFVQDGDWDTKKTSLENKVQAKIVEDLFVRSIDIDKQSIFPELVENKLRHDPGLSREDAGKRIIDSYNNLKKVFSAIKEHGYKTQKELGKSDENRFNTWYDEIRVSIDRNGGYMLNGSGNHRVAIAKILKLEKIPVLVIRKHYLYERSRHNVQH